jgi:hypothetical protein
MPKRLPPGAPIRRDPDREIVAADEPRLGPPAIAALVELRKHVARPVLVEDEAQIARAALACPEGGEERRIELRGHPVRGIRRGADSEPLQVVEGADERPEP